MIIIRDEQLKKFTSSIFGEWCSSYPFGYSHGKMIEKALLNHLSDCIGNHLQEKPELYEDFIKRETEKALGGPMKTVITRKINQIVEAKVQEEMEKSFDLTPTFIEEVVSKLNKLQMRKEV